MELIIFEVGDDLCSLALDYSLRYNGHWRFLYPGEFGSGVGEVCYPKIIIDSKKERNSAYE